MYPRSGGVYVYLREAFGPMLAFLYGWAALLIFFSGGIAAVAVGFADYLSYFAPALSPSRILWSVAMPAGTWTVSAAQIVAVVCIASLAAINYVGVRSGNRVNVVLTVAKVPGLAALPILALIAARRDPRVDAGRRERAAPARRLRHRDDCRALGQRRLVLRDLDRRRDARSAARSAARADYRDLSADRRSTWLVNVAYLVRAADRRAPGRDARRRTRRHGRSPEPTARGSSRSPS